jgi:aspartate aminotransferase-like enzyme
LPGAHSPKLPTALPVEIDALDIEILVIGAQKALSGPPGLSAIAIGERA